MKTIAILGPTASGKTALSIALALEHQGIILSLDSLSIYKEIDIASAKPTLEERQGIPHFGIDELLPNEPFNVVMFFELYNKALTYAKCHDKNLFIVGGTGFYLKALMDGLSQKPSISLHVKEQIQTHLHNLPETYAMIEHYDSAYAQKIASTDRYRIEKWLEIFLSANTIPSAYLISHRNKALLEDVELFEIETDKEALRKKIALRTELMLKNGLIDEVFALENHYTRAPQCMKSIGIKEVLDYFDGKYALNLLHEKITTNTVQLAKRQRTFNTSQFPPHIKQPLEKLYGIISETLHGEPF
ncbi:MAG: tRNA (adenosine(37)-N6)-dimethylallyltransferase MiaA [Sulfurospirillaceae bacterium]|nr:tRNA (adenosine(37)-N6)-dimethylallyltransferase MiaA [Sulfurospirillaceae bacterium]